MKLPIETGAMSFMCASEPEPVVDYDSKQPKSDENGQPLYATQVVVLGDDGAEVISLKTPGKPAIEAGQMISVRSLIATPWVMGDRNGIAFRATTVEPAAALAGRPAKA